MKGYRNSSIERKRDASVLLGKESIQVHVKTNPLFFLMIVPSFSLKLTLVNGVEANPKDSYSPNTILCIFLET